jgi:hypothetical protein
MSLKDNLEPQIADLRKALLNTQRQLARCQEE